MQKIREFTHQFDMFAASPTLRAHGQSDIVNACGGFFSLALLAVFIYVFIDLNIKTVRYY